MSMAKYLVIVESPSKAKTIKKYLSGNYTVIASQGHIRDLPKSSLGIDIEHDFEPHYITIRGKGELLAQLKTEAKKADKIFLATDPDREGEAISWHLAIALGLSDKQVYRVAFNEITKNAVKAAIKEPRKIDMNLVDAQQARRALDRIVGYEISPVLWKKVKRGLSAGRVQSVTLRLLCEREDEINDFVKEEFWTIEGSFVKEGASGKINTKLSHVDGEKPEIHSQKEAEALMQRIEKTKDFSVKEIRSGKRIRKAPDPFTTSTLQQEASKRLNFSPSKTMRVAQMLYEGVDLPGRGMTGMISYLRTDSVRISEEMQAAAKEYIGKQYGADFAGEGEHTPKSGARIQDAHEAIRPTSLELEPKSVEEALGRDGYRLYKLIWDRFMASQMSAAQYETQKITIEGNGMEFDASGSALRFAGFMKVYQEADEDEEKIQNIAGLNMGDTVKAGVMSKLQHFTQPPARYTEGTLVKALEDNGIGRPSTYAPTITTLTARDYVAKEKKVLYVTELGNLVNDITCQYFDNVDSTSFTAKMENELDQVGEGQKNWKAILREFYEDFEPQVQKAMKELEKVKLEDPVTDVICDKCGRNMVLKNGRFGKFYACPGFPECHNTKPYFDFIDATCPKCGGSICVKKSRKGRTYYGCENSPECDFMSWDRPSMKDCPVCGHRLYEKRGKKISLVCLEENCSYSEEVTAAENTED